MKFLQLCLALVGLQYVTAQNFYDKNADIAELTPKTFDKVVHRTNYTTLVEFYAPWCGYCQQLKGIMKKAAKNLDGIVQVASVNCDEAKNKQLCAQYRVEGFPTLMVFRPPKFDLNKSPEDRIRLGNHASEVYKGERKLRPLVDFCVSRVKNYVNRIQRLEKLVDTLSAKPNSRLKAVLFSQKEKISPMYKSLALDWLGAIDFHVFLNSKLRDSADHLKKLPNDTKDLFLTLQETQVESELSKLVIFDTETQKHYVYDGSSFDKASLWRFLSQWAQSREGPFTKRQAYLDGVKSNSKKVRNKNKKNKAAEENPHDEL
ncbi:LAME_0H05138g1_1 [Lachancea meyersii CBS 8951]|uniref:LAME_0H05138g1_1 n=1 Tax=Lachancea meyersii CBS 8951 TaxID=1266667 RepID=A0A1G4KE34_9SACH|nr:LAME_0H05138g1_1 [Lachancea meyersii CBS 8951]